MKNEERILELLAELLRRADRTDEQILELKERFNKVEWRHDDLVLRQEESRRQQALTDKQIAATNQAVSELTQAVATMVNAQVQLDSRLRRLERPDDAAANQAT